MRLRSLVIVAALLLLCPTLARAQTPPPDVDNPRAVAFTPSLDHALIDSYELTIISPSGAVTQVLNIGKPTPDATNTCEVPINVQPVAFGVGYTVRARARAGSAVSPDAVSENKFNRVPGAPSKVVNK